ncbi:hypothetical protein N7468_000116 [Penicillium chermesinum]|uniref:Shugoshin C-terminal domain-containing protein n=1 Tax=Penicillium chermesinum TaxID=63820 RepID=A0A9W9PLQ9_9EURO|nr:uncharacterized protein N7468_000116 [Penicillium chermesinum]KAJ5248665.1 hypothetical protein N7468_000116 [Penicillium chermesinum]
MARLNDFAAPSESIEACIKETFRQAEPRDSACKLDAIAANPQLGVGGVAPPGENVSLREQVINLTSEIERLEAAKVLHDGVYEIKSRLDAKLAELGSLASDLGKLPRKFAKSSKPDTNADHPKVSTLEPRRPVDFDSTMDDGRLPSILEDKHFPRRTLESQEIQQLVQESLSPLRCPAEPSLLRDTEISKPEEKDENSAIETPCSSLQESVLENFQYEAVESDPFLPPTLETRKKKKRTESATSVEEKVLQSDPTPQGISTQIAKSGSKRKFSPDEDGIPSDTAPEDDEFEFTRSSQSPRRKTDVLEPIRQDGSPSKTPRVMKRVPPGGIGKRKVLEPKSTNVNLASPKKSRSLQSENKISQLMGDGENAVSPQEAKQLDGPQTQNLQEPPPITKTKGKRSVASATTSLPNYAQPKPGQKRDSPAAKTVSMDTISDLASASRTSRRRGAVISYAEPNLRDKMRRPTKDMIDAVSKDGRRSSSFQASRESFDGSSGTPRGPISPHLRFGTNMPADFALADQISDVLSSEAVLAKVSQRKPPRRHSSHPRVPLMTHRQWVRRL